MTWKIFSSLIVHPNKQCIRSIFLNGTLKNLHTQVPVKEIQIPVKWGHLACKLWGNENEQPILALHGWQDNAGTWDTLAPLLCEKRPILAIDFPGHGHSSWIPAGMQYYPWELPRLILQIKDYFKWNKISLLCHSMGSIAGMRFACVFPDDIDFYIAIDSLIIDDHDLKQFVDGLPNILRKTQKVQQFKGEPPVYTMEELIKVWHLGTSKSVALESVPHLIARGAKESSTVPNKYYFTRDPRLKNIIFSVEDKKFVETLIKRLKCPTLYIKAIDSPYAADEYSVEMRDIIAKNNTNFECHFLPGTHHIHLNNADLILPYILRFLNNHKFIS